MRRLLLPVVCLALVAGCATVPLLQFIPLDPPLRASPVAERLIGSADSVRVEARFDRIEGEEILFGLELWNLTQADLDVDPAAFEYRVVLPDGQETPGGRAIDPEWQLAVHDQRTSLVLARAPKEPDEVSGWQLLGDFLDLLTSGSRTEQEERDRELIRLKQAEEERAARTEHDRRLDRLRRQRETLVRERLRHALLPPGQRLTGRIAFPVRPLTDAMQRLEGHGSGITRTDPPANADRSCLVLRCRVGDLVRDRRFRIHRY